MKLSIRTIGAAIAMAVLGSLVPRPAEAVPLLTAAFWLERDLGGTYEGRFDVHNMGISPASGWTLSFELPAGQEIVSATEGIEVGAGGRHVVTNQAWNGVVSPGATVGFGITVRYAGPYAPPAGCMISGRVCAGAGWLGPMLSVGSWGFTPYADVLLWPPTDLVAAMREGGSKYFTLAFVVSRNACEATWGGIIPVGDPSDDVRGRINAVRAAGGDVVVSFGGASGQELAQTCSSVDALVSQYRRVVDTYSVYSLDFDIEGAALPDDAANARRAAAIARLQAMYPGLTVSFTLPAFPSGLTQDGVDLVTGLRNAGVNVAIVNIMAMDYGRLNAPDPHGNMGEYAIQAATATKNQVKNVFFLLNDQAAWRRVGITPMIGQNDVPGELFDLHDAKQVMEFAHREGVGRLAMWSVGRDRQCVHVLKPVADPACSGIAQDAGAFSRVLSRYKG